MDAYPAEFIVKSLSTEYTAAVIEKSYLFTDREFAPECIGFVWGALPLLAASSGCLLSIWHDALLISSISYSPSLSLLSLSFSPCAAFMRFVHLRLKLL